MTAPEPLTPEETAAAAMAADALKLALDGDWPYANTLTQGLLDIYGQHGALVAMLLWADALIEYRGGRETGRFTQLTFFDVNEGPNPTEHGADEAPPWARWAGRFIFARVRDDQDQGRALLESCAGDEEQFESNVLGVLEMVAETITIEKRHRRGQ